MYHMITYVKKQLSILRIMHPPTLSLKDTAHDTHTTYIAHICIGILLIITAYI